MTEVSFVLPGEGDRAVHGRAADDDLFDGYSDHV